jgi:Peptidase propeptide and YPEB domain
VSAPLAHKTQVTNPYSSGKFSAPIAGVSPAQDKLQRFHGGHDVDEILRRLFSTRLRYRGRGLYGRGAGAEGKRHHRPGPTIALKARHGTITDEELEREKGGSGLRYSFDIKSNKVIYEVGVDARTGKVLENVREGAHPD